MQAQCKVNDTSALVVAALVTALVASCTIELIVLQRVHQSRKLCTYLFELKLL